MLPVLVDMLYSDQYSTIAEAAWGVGYMSAFAPEEVLKELSTDALIARIRELLL